MSWDLIPSIKDGLEPYGIREFKKDLKAAIRQRDKKFWVIDINIRSKIYLIVCFFWSNSDEAIKGILKRNLNLDIPDRQIMAMIRKAKSEFADFAQIMWSLRLRRMNECTIIYPQRDLSWECYSNWVRIEIFG